MRCDIVMQLENGRIPGIERESIIHICISGLTISDLPLVMLRNLFLFLSLPLQLRDMLTRTIECNVTLFDPANTTHLPQFKVQLCLEGSNMEFFPSLSDLEATLLSFVDIIAEAMSNVPNIQVNTPPCPHMYMYT